MEKQQRRDNSFFFWFAVLLLGIVIGGFTPSLFLRAAFDPPPIPVYLHLHGIILTGWFVWLVCQARLIRKGNTALHRKLGYFAAAYGALVVAGGLMATLNVVPRALSRGITFETDMADVNPALGEGIGFLDFISGVVWANIASVTTFALLLVCAVIFRARPAVHKRLLLVATVSIIGPALARISRLEFLGGEQGPFITVAMLCLLAAFVVHDLIAIRKIHLVTVLAIALVIGMGFLVSAVSGSEAGLAFVRSLA